MADEMGHTFVDYDATCHTTGCSNEDVTLRVPSLEEGPSIQCGPCGIPITDAKRVTEGNQA